MNLSILSDILDIPSVLLGKNDMDIHLRNLYKLRSGIHCSPDYAYLLTTEELALLVDQNSDQSLSFLIVGTTPREFPSEWNILLLHTQLSPDQVFEKASQAFDIYRDWHDRLTQAVLEKQSAQQQLDIAAELLHNPLALYDEIFTLVAWSGTLPEVIDDPIWKHALNQGYTILHTVPHEYQMELAQTAFNPRPVFVPSLDTPCENHILTANVAFQERPAAAHLCQDEIVAPFTPGDQAVMRRIQLLFQHSTDLLNQISLFGQETSFIFAALAKGQSVGNVMRERFFRINNWPENTPYSIHFIHINAAPENANAIFHGYAREFNLRFPDLLTFLVEGNIVLVELDSKKPLYANADYKAYIKHITFPVGISMRFWNHSLLPQALTQAQASSMLNRENPGTIVCFEDVWADCFFDRVIGEIPQYYVCHPSILALLFGNEWEHDLLRTLYVYLQNGMYAAKSALSLGIHRNTLIHRLHVLEEKYHLPLGALTASQLDHLILSALIAMRHLEKQSRV